MGEEEETCNQTGGSKEEKERGEEAKTQGEHGHAVRGEREREDSTRQQSASNLPFPPLLISYPRIELAMFLQRPPSAFPPLLPLAHHNPVQ